MWRHYGADVPPAGSNVQPRTPAPQGRARGGVCTERSAAYRMRCRRHATPARQIHRSRRPRRLGEEHAIATAARRAGEGGAGGAGGARSGHDSDRRAGARDPAGPQSPGNVDALRDAAVYVGTRTDDGRGDSAGAGCAAGGAERSVRLQHAGVSAWRRGDFRGGDSTGCGCGDSGEMAGSDDHFGYASGQEHGARAAREGPDRAEADGVSRAGAAELSGAGGGGSDVSADRGGSGSGSSPAWSRASSANASRIRRPASRR